MRLENARAQALDILAAAVARKAQLLRNEIVETLSRPGAGRIYEDRFAMIGGQLRKVGKRAVPHQASAPGAAPATDGGRLVQSITALKVEPFRWRVGTNVEYALYLEFGTRAIAPRPFIRPAVEAVRGR